VAQFSRADQPVPRGEGVRLVDLLAGARRRNCRGSTVVEAGRQCRAAGRILDGALLVQAIRQADLLLVHKASSQALADRLVAMEQGR
jgi:hypothetical protein